jgi:hypothetical protein
MSMFALHTTQILGVSTVTMAPMVPLRLVWLGEHLAEAVEILQRLFCRQ